jgi:PAP2 superfamily
VTISRVLPAAVPLDGPRRVPRWAVEALLLAGLYLAGELARGVARGGEPTAEAHAATIVRLERRLHVFDEATIQHAADLVGGLPTLLGYAYVSLHLVGTVGVLVWAYRRHRDAYARLRNTLVLAGGLAIAGYALFPTAPPRLVVSGIEDTVSRSTAIDLHSTLVSSLYNPYAAIPSVHIVFSVIVGVAVARLARPPLWRMAGALYPVLVLLVIVATGNHFFFDAAAGAAVAGIALAATALAPRLRAGLRHPTTAEDVEGEPALDMAA